MKQKDFKKISMRIMLGIVILLLLVFIYSGIRGIIYMLESNRTHKELDEIKDLIDIDYDTDDEDKVEKDINDSEEDNNNDNNFSDESPIDEPHDTNQKYTPTVDNTNKYKDYLNTNPMNVDLSKLKERNSDTVAWIKVNGTSVSYPVVQATDNVFYLNRSFDKTSNGAGWVFADYRNNFKELDKNTVIYGHGRFDKTMFGTLKDLFTSDWQKNPQNHIINLSTENENTVWQIFSFYHIPTTSDYIKIQFSTDTEFLELTNSLIQRSAYNFNVQLDKEDKILTLSTCLNSEDKIVVHAKLIKSNSKK